MFQIQLTHGPHQEREEIHWKQLQKLIGLFPGQWESLIRMQELVYYLNHKVESENIIKRYQTEMENSNKGESKEVLKQRFEEELIKYEINPKTADKIRQLLEKKEKQIEMQTKNKKSDSFGDFLRNRQAQYNDHLISYCKSQIHQIEKIMRHPTGGKRYEKNFINNYAMDETIRILNRNVDIIEKEDNDTDQFWK